MGPFGEKLFFHFQRMKGSVTGKVVDWENGETMDQMVDQFGPWDYTGLSRIILDRIMSNLTQSDPGYLSSMHESE